VRDWEPEREPVLIVDAPGEYRCGMCYTRLPLPGILTKQCAHCGTTFRKVTSPRPTAELRTAIRGWRRDLEWYQPPKGWV
jgi:hypothetical protein